MILPHKVRIGPSYYSVAVECMEDDGGSNANSLHIKISDKLTDEKKASTFLHEIIHCIFEEYNVRLKDKKEEQVILAVEAGLCSFAKDNQEAFLEIVKFMGCYNDK